MDISSSQYHCSMHVFVMSRNERDVPNRLVISLRLLSQMHSLLINYSTLILCTIQCKNEGEVIGS